MAVAIVGLLAVAAVTIDGARGYMVQQELRNASEASAHAAAMQLDGTTFGIERAIEYSAMVADLHQAAGTGVSFGDEGELELGYLQDGVFVADTSDASVVTAARVGLRMPSVATFFAEPVFGIESMAASASASALGGGPASADCPFPIAIPSCGLPKNTDGTYCNLQITLGPDNNDNGAWARLGTSVPNASWIKSSFASCSGANDVGDAVTLNNGQVASGAKELADQIEASSSRWDSATWGTQPAQLTNSAVAKAKYGNVIEGQIMVFDDPGNCGSTKFTGQYDIDGYATAVIYDAIATGNAADRKIAMFITCDTTQERAGGNFYGTKVPPQFF